MTSPGRTTTTNYGADGNVTTSQTVDASGETQAQTVVGTGSGALGAVIGAANFVYSIIKDHGAKFSGKVETGGDGVASGTFDDTRFRSEPVGEYSASGIWYTHTRAYGALLDRHRTGMSHEKTPSPTEFGSAYLCTVFPYQLRWNLHRVVPKPIGDTQAAKQELEFVKAEREAYDSFHGLLEGYRIKPGSLVLGSGKKAVKFRLKEPEENFENYVAFVKQFNRKEPRLGAAVAELEQNLAVVRQQRAEFGGSVTKATTGATEFYVLRNVTIEELTEHRGIRQRFWQHLSINSKFTITPRHDRPYGFRVGLVWGEQALGYGYPGMAGYFEVVQTGPSTSDIAITGDSKLGRRFLQFRDVKKER